jgi:hypothetical protein
MCVWHSRKRHGYKRWDGRGSGAAVDQKTDPGIGHDAMLPQGACVRVWWARWATPNPDAKDQEKPKKLSCAESTPANAVLMLWNDWNVPKGHLFCCKAIT